MDEGCITLNGRPVKPTHTPRVGEQIHVRIPEPVAAIAQPEQIPLDILFEDEILLVVNKPAGLVVHPAAGHETSTLVNALLHHCRGQLSGIGGVARPGIVHRLDKDTSGCLVIAKTDPAHVALSNQFAGRQTVKIYQAILCGELEKTRGDISAPIARHTSDRKRMSVQDHGREARTSWTLVERLNGATHVEAVLHTGRTHQIRVHFKHIGHPLLGDLVYGDRQNHKLEDRTHYHAPRQMLHAAKLTFTHPRTGKPLTCQAPTPEDFADALSALKIR